MSQDFVRFLTEELLNLGANRIKDKNDAHIEFEMDTIVGKLSISIPKEQNSVFYVFSRFQDVDKAKKKFYCNPYSGKYNFYIGITQGITAKVAVEIVISSLELTQDNKFKNSTTKPL